MTDLSFKIKSAFDSLKKITKNTLKGDALVSSEVKRTRLNICFECESFRSSTRQCVECGCFMELKAGLKDMTCYKDKWNE
jgi:hypothetical protein